MYFHLLGGGMWLTLSIVCLLIAITTLKRSDSLTLRSLQFLMLCLVATFMGIVGLAQVSSVLCNCTWPLDTVYGLVRIAVVNMKGQN
jgi:hypothetical protein